MAGKQEIRRAGGISALVDLLEHDCMEASGIDSDITIATTEVLWKLSFDQVRTAADEPRCEAVRVVLTHLLKPLLFKPQAGLACNL